jgi:hypothetical protein
MKARSRSSSTPARFSSFINNVSCCVKLAVSAVVLMGLSVGVGAQTVSGLKPAESPLNIDTVLWWLPEDTETIFAAQGPFKLTPQDPRSQPGRSLQIILQTTNLSVLAGSEENARFKQVLGRTVLLAIEGSRHFRPPSGLGSTMFDGCEIIEFKGEPGQDSETLKKLIGRLAKRKEILNGVEVFVFEEKLEQDLWTVFVASPRPNLFLAATNAGYLKEVLNRMSYHGETRALPDSLPEWKYVNRSAPFWAVRHFDPKNASQDPTSPFGGRKAANIPDEQAVGVAFSFSAVADKTPAITYLSASPGATRIAREQWSVPSEGLNPEIHESEPGVVLIGVPVKDDTALSSFLLELFALFGHAVFL